jgi:hypothetical protein
MMVHDKKDKEFFFYNNEIKRCIKGTRQRWIKFRPDIPNIWLVKIDTNLSRKEILDLANAGFQLPQRAIISPRRLFGMEELPFDHSSYPLPTSPDDHPKTRSG